MISLKIGTIIAIAAFAAGSLFAPPVQQAIAAVIATDVQCTGCVGTSDSAGNAITGVKIKDGEVKAAEIATDAVGAAELQGVSKLLFGQCSTSDRNGSGQGPGASTTVVCNISGADTDDSVIATLNYDGLCYGVEQAFVKSNGVVWVNVKNDCTISQTFPTASAMSVIVYDK